METESVDAYVKDIEEKSKGNMEVKEERQEQVGNPRYLKGGGISLKHTPRIFIYYFKALH